MHPGWPNGGPDHAFAVTGGAKAPAAARRAMTPVLEEHLGDERLHDAMLLVSEVVTNAVRHGGAGEEDQVRLAFGLDDGYVRIEVRDGGPGFEPERPPSPREGGGGLGLVLLHSITRRYGVDVGDGTRVWFDLERQAA